MISLFLLLSLSVLLCAERTDLVLLWSTTSFKGAKVEVINFDFDHYGASGCRQDFSKKGSVCGNILLPTPTF